MKKLAIITTHPIQYYAPLFSMMAKSERLAIKVFYTWGNVAADKHDPGFGKSVEWDIPLLDNYEHVFVKNTSSNPGSHHFFGIQNPSIIKDIDAFRPDAILVFGWCYAGHLKVITHYSGKTPLYFRGDSHLLDTQHSIKNQIKKLVLKWVYSHFHKVFYVGHYNKEYFLHFGIKSNKLVWAPHAIDNERFIHNDDMHTAKAYEIRKKLNIGYDEKVILFAGKLEPKKNPVILYKAFERLLIPRVHLVFVGNGVQEQELKKMAENQKNVHFLDFQNQTNMPAIYRICDIFCLPSKGPKETWGLAVNEAMACGKAVLVSDKAGCSYDLVMNDGNGYIFKSEDTGSLMKKLSWMLKNADLEKMGTLSRQIISKWNYRHLMQVIEETIIGAA